MTTSFQPHPPWCTVKHPKPTDPTRYSELHEHRLSGTRALFAVTVSALDETTPTGSYSGSPSITCEGRIDQFDMDGQAARQLAAKLRRAADQLEAAATQLAEIRRTAR